MNVVDVGSGSPLVLVPGVQGRWEWMRPAVDTLAQRCRVITFSLADEPSCGATFDERDGFSCYVQEIEEAMNVSGVDRAAICGVSYGGLIAAAFAARHPDRVSALVLVSAMPPTWRPDARARFYLRAPRLLSPLFFVQSLRMYREIAAASPSLLHSVTASVRHATNVLAHMLSPARMARRLRWQASMDLRDELAPLTVPTLVITGEDGLDRVIPPARTREYLRMWPHARSATIPRTGHLGLITKPDVLAGLVVPFIERAAPDRERERRVG